MVPPGFECRTTLLGIVTQEWEYLVTMCALKLNIGNLFSFTLNALDDKDKYVRLC